MVGPAARHTPAVAIVIPLPTGLAGIAVIAGLTASGRTASASR
jgi:hypothetical protein